RTTVGTVHLSSFFNNTLNRYSDSPRRKRRESAVAGLALLPEGRQGKSGVKPARFPPLCTGDCVAAVNVWSLGSLQEPGKAAQPTRLSRESGNLACISSGQ